MKVELQLDRPLGDHGPLFTATDYVRGVVNLTLQHEDAVSRITIELSGELFTSVVAAATNSLGSTDHASYNHKLLHLSHTLFPPPDIPISPNGFSLQKGIQTFPFQFRFPILSACDDTKKWVIHLNTTLPPSFKVAAPKNVAITEMKYWLKAKVERPGRFKPDVIELQELKFMPLDPSLPPPMLEPINRRHSIYLLPEPTAARNSSLSSAAQRLDNATVTLEVTLPSPAIIYTKGSLPLKVFVFAKEASAPSSPPIILRTLNVTLLTEFTVTVGPNSTTWPVFHPLINHTELRIEIQDFGKPPGGLSSDLWKDCVVPDVTPSFTTCTHMQQHFLVVTAGFLYGDNRQIQTIKTTINVDIHSGIKPALDSTSGGESEQDTDSEPMPYIPWRVGSERHLGIMRQSDSTSESTAPPAYY